MKAINPGLSKTGRRLLGILACVAVTVVLGISAWMAHVTDPQIEAEFTSGSDSLSADEIEVLSSIKPQCAMVLGAGVYSDGTPSPMLRDRLDTGIALYKAGVVPKLLLSGDDGQVEYSEVDVMLNYALDRDIPKEDIFLDHAGFSTYESVYRANYIFEIKRMLVVTQTYHLFRALYGCRRMGVEALGVGADQQQYVGSTTRELREVLARDKDWAKWLIKPDPTFLGEKIPIEGDGRQTQ